MIYTEQLVCWIYGEKNRLLEKGIVTDEIVSIGDTLDEPCARVDQSRINRNSEFC